MTDETENQNPTEMDKKQDAEREAKGTEGAETDGDDGEKHEASTYTDQGRPV